jgi:uncharacterized protein (DUF1800 family)
MRGVDPSTVEGLDLLDAALAGDLSDTTRATIAKATSAPQAAALTLGSPEFQRR